MTKKIVKKEYIETAKEFAKKAETKGYKIDALYLFGSRISGKPTEWSDLDICLVSPSIKKNLFDERVKLFKIGLGVNDLIEPHPMSPKDFNDEFNNLAREVKRTGYKVVLGSHFK